MGKNDPLTNLIFNVVATIGVFCSLGGLGVLGYQIYWYLRVGEWYSFSIIIGLRWLDIAWAFYPSEWIGVYKILNDFPLSLGIWICGLIPFFTVCYIMGMYHKHFVEKKQD